jgi:hypothetical protein
MMKMTLIYLVLASTLALIVWTTLILGYFIVDYQLVRIQLRTKLRTN